MNKYIDDRFELKWLFMGTDGIIYSVVFNPLAETFHIFQNQDIKQLTYRITYENYVVKNNYKPLTGEFHSIDNHNLYVIAINNTLHCETMSATVVPHGLEIFQAREDVEHYIIHGKIMSHHTWLTWVKTTESWPFVMANILGSKNKEY